MKLLSFMFSAAGCWKFLPDAIRLPASSRTGSVCWPNYPFSVYSYVASIFDSWFCCTLACSKSPSMRSRCSLNFLRLTSIWVAAILKLVICFYCSWMIGSEITPMKEKYCWILVRWFSGDSLAKKDISLLILVDCGRTNMLNSSLSMRYGQRATCLMNRFKRKQRSATNSLFVFPTVRFEGIGGM